MDRVILTGAPQDCNMPKREDECSREIEAMPEN
jgi:hypothetical protein